jgi:hypothetical protein
VRQLEAEVARLEEELRKAHTILEVQEKLALLQFEWVVRMRISRPLTPPAGVRR